MTLIYLAEPIDQTTHHYTTAGTQVYTRAVADSLHTALAELYNVYRPRTAFNCTTLDPRVDGINRTALDQADLLVALLPNDVATVGTAMEVQYAVTRGTPTVVVTGTPGQALTALATQRHVQVLTPNPDLGIIDSVLAAITHLFTHRTHRPAPPQVQMVIADGCEIPNRAYPDDAGFDLTVMPQPDDEDDLPGHDGTWTIRPGQFLDIPSQVQNIQLPPDTWALITGRSSTLRKHGLHIPTAIIDPGWRGPLFTGVWNLSGIVRIVQPGTRLAQVILHRNHTAQHTLVQVQQVDTHDRGHHGFGSSG